jgi:hypothetical protein
MSSPLMRLAVSCVRGWTRLYTWRMPPASRQTRRAEIESDVWESQSDAAGDHVLGSALHILLRLLIGIPDDLGWRAEQAAKAGTLTQRSIALSARVAGAALFVCALWVIDADAGRRRPATAAAGPAAVVDQEIEEIMAMRAGNVALPAGRRLPLLTAGIVATVGGSMLPQLAAQLPPIPGNGPAFEVLSIKPTPTGFAGPTQNQIQPGGRFTATDTPVRLIIGQQQAAILIDDFESGTLANWSINRNGAGGWFVYANGHTPPEPSRSDPNVPFSVPDPPQGKFAAVTDMNGPGTRILYREVRLNGRYMLHVTVFYVNAGEFGSPETLAYDINETNQQFRIDLVGTSAPVDSLAQGDVLANVFHTSPGDPDRREPADVTFDLSRWQGQTVRLRLASVDNRGPLRVGVDSIRLEPIAR